MVIAAPTYSPNSLIVAEVGQWVASETDPVRTLTNVACLVGNQFRCDACSIYLADPQTLTLTLGGTVGLRQECVGRIRMTFAEGLTGLCARTREPVVVPEAAAEHPAFRYFPEAGEDLYESFLGLPLLCGDSAIGVLVLQTFEATAFESADVRRLVTLAGALVPHLQRLIEPLFAQLAQAATAAESTAVFAP